MLAMPRGEWDDIDPAWTTSPGLAACVGTSNVAPDLRGLGHEPERRVAHDDPRGRGGEDRVGRRLRRLGQRHHAEGPPGGAERGRLRRAPHHGRVRRIPELPPLAAGWTTGAIQVTDARFGSSFDAAVASPWASGTGVVPDQVVLQKVSDLLAGTDTVLAAARAWLTR